MKVVLKSEREINYEKPNFRNRTKIWDRAVKDHLAGVPLSLENCMDIVLYCKIATEAQLNEDEFTVEELYEIGNHLLLEFWTVELDKKKLK